MTGALLLASLSPSNAAPIPQKDSEDFNYLYTSTQLPNQSTPAWLLYQGGSGNTQEIVDGVLHIESPGAPSYSYYALGNANWRSVMDTTVGFTVEIKMRVGEGTQGGITLALNEGSVLGAGYGVLRLDGDGTHWDESSSSTFTTVDTDSNTDDYHVFRLVKLASTETEAGRFSLYRDGVLIFEDRSGSYSSSTPADRFFFGNTGSWVSSVDVEYVRWDTTGAYAPVPEPGAVALLAISAAMGLGFYKFRTKE